MGKPSMAMIAAFCCAFAAIAARNVKTRLRLQPPNNTNPINGRLFEPGCQEKTEKQNTQQTHQQHQQLN